MAYPMTELSPDGLRVAQTLAQRHGFSVDAVSHMLYAVLAGNGSMAQFNHGEFAGSGQWMAGGMIMLGDMFNNQLKNRVDALCCDIANILADQPGLLRSGSFQSQSQGGSSTQHQAHGGSRGTSTLFEPDPENDWWPQELGSPDATGSQNTMKYAYFANARRLAVQAGGEIWVYDTADHQIGGFSQQQGSSNNITFSSQFGVVPLPQLSVVTRNGQSVAPAAPSPAQQPPAQSPSNSAPAATAARGSDEIFAALEKLGALNAKGVLADDEFAAKKRELLDRL